MAVLLTLPTGNRVFVSGIRWVPHARRPSLPAIRQEALAMGMTNYVRPKQIPNRIGYLKMVAERSGEKTTGKAKIESLLLAVLSQSGPSTYVECDFGPSGIWVMATDENSLPLPGSDNFFTDEDLEGYRSSLVGFNFKQKLLIEPQKVDAFMAALPATPVIIRSVSFRPYYIAASIFAVCGLVVLQSMHVLHERNLAHLRDEARRNLLLEQQKAQAATHEGPSAGEWVKICMHNAYALPPFKDGWTLNNWECAGRTLSALWVRTGGTLADAPVGLMLNNGNSVRSHYPLLPYEKIHGAPSDATGDAKTFIALVQRSEANLSVKTADLAHDDHSKAQSAYMITFPWQGDPREIPWDFFRDISVERLGREINADAHGALQNTDYQIHVAIKDASAAAVSTESGGH
ncbi:type 4b pilus protein PilO2 [Acetobacter lambici]|nr:type 4b pilus protein PilO2 [Acetobacter lambici]